MFAFHTANPPHPLHITSLHLPIPAMPFPHSAEKYPACSRALPSYFVMPGPSGAAMAEHPMLDKDNFGARLTYDELVEVYRDIAERVASKSFTIALLQAI